MTFMLDCSHYQGTINWPQVKAAGCVGVMVKTTDGATGVDANWQINHAGAQSVGLPVSPYHFSEDGNPATEAAHFASIWSAGWDFRPWLDEEKTTANAAFIRTFRSTWRGITNYPLFGVYSSENLLTGRLAPSGWIDPQTGIWAARYAPSLGWDEDQLLIWQFSSAATIPGVLGHVDESEFMHGWAPGTDGALLAPTTSTEEDMIQTFSFDPTYAAGATPTSARHVFGTETNSMSQVANQSWIWVKSGWGSMDAVHIIAIGDAPAGSATARYLADQTWTSIAGDAGRCLMVAPDGTDQYSVEVTSSAPYTVTIAVKSK
jgi:hypothetical protein